MSLLCPPIKELPTCLAGNGNGILQGAGTISSRRPYWNNTGPETLPIMTGTQSTGTPSEDKRKNTGHFLNIPAHRLLNCICITWRIRNGFSRMTNIITKTTRDVCMLWLAFFRGSWQSFSYLSCRSSFHFSAYVVCRERRRRIESKSRDVIKTFLF